MDDTGIIVQSEAVRERLKRLRLARNWTQADVARRTDMSVATVSQIETGKAYLYDGHIEEFARAFGYSPEYLCRSRSLAPTSRPWLRAFADASKKELAARVAKCELAAEIVDIARLRRMPDLVPVSVGDMLDDQEIEDLALDVRSIAEIDEDAVVGNMIRAAERLGCVVLPFRSELGRHVGMSLLANQIPMICVANSLDVPGDRQRFTVAHELGHLVLHSGMKPPADSNEAGIMERQAHRFAASFLVPAEPLVDSLDSMSKRVTLDHLSHIKALWGVSIKALVGRFRDIGVISAENARSLYKQISWRGWNKSEPVEVGSESAQWFARALMARSESDTLSAAVHTLSSNHGLNRRDLYELASWELRETGGDIVDFPSNAASRARQPRR